MKGFRPNLSDKIPPTNIKKILPKPIPEATNPTPKAIKLILTCLNYLSKIKTQYVWLFSK